MSVEENKGAWRRVFRRWNKPFITLFGDKDAVSRGGERPWKELVPGAEGQKHAIIEVNGCVLLRVLSLLLVYVCVCLCVCVCVSRSHDNLSSDISHVPHVCNTFHPPMYPLVFSGVSYSLCGQGGGHFIQEDCPDELCERLLTFIDDNPMDLYPAFARFAKL